MSTPKGWLAEKSIQKVSNLADKLQTLKPEWVVSHNGDKFFALWAYYVDAQIRGEYGISLYDLEDWLIYDSYLSGDSPKEAAEEAISNDSLYSNL